MLLWLSLAIVSAVVLTALLAPLLRPEATLPAADVADQTVYKDQLAEIDADRERGLIGEPEAEAAKRELARRLLARVSRAETAGNPAGPGRAAPVAFNRALVAAIALVPAAALLIYNIVGSPGLPAQPYLARAAAPGERNSVDQLVARVEGRLREHPEDGAGWDVIAPVYAHQERFREAAEAYGHAIRLLGPSPKRLAGFAEASVIAGNGIVSEPARLAYQELLGLDPRNVEARFWLAMAKEQDGRVEAATADYRSLLEGAPADAPWRKAVESRLAALGNASGGGGAITDLGRGAAPGPEASSQIQNLPPDERLRMISSMVDGLAARLKLDGRDLNGWLRLVRAYKVLGREEAARAAVSDARKAMQGDAAAVGEIDALAKSLGIGS